MKPHSGKKKKGFVPGSSKGRFNADGTPRQKANDGLLGVKRNKRGRVRRKPR